MLINKVYELVQELANKDEASGYITPSDYNTYAETAQYEIIASWYNNPNAYRYDLREPRKGYEVSQTISDALKPLKVKTLLSPNSNGELTQPSDYMHFSSALVNFNDNRDGIEVPTVSQVEVIRDNELAERLGSEIERPTDKYPIVVQYADFWQVYPKDIEQIDLTYIREPLTPWWNYTLSSGRPVFAETGGVTTNPNAGVTAGDSTDYILPERMIFELAYKICEYMGISVRDGDLYQTSVNQASTEV